MCLIKDAASIRTTHNQIIHLLKEKINFNRMDRVINIK